MTTGQEMRSEDMPQPRDVAVSLEAIGRNLDELRRRAGGLPVIADVRADAYGHGAPAVARFLETQGVAALLVSSIADGVDLREHGVESPILSLRRLPQDDFSLAARRSITPVVASSAELLSALGGGVTAVHLAVDPSGREGADEARWASLLDATLSAVSQGLVDVAGLLVATRAAGTDASFADRVIADLALNGARPALVQIITSESLVGDRGVRGTAVRLGRGLYGLSPLPGREASEFGLTPAFRLSARVVATKVVEAGEGVSYGYVYRTSSRTTLAMVPLGYGDGIDRHACEGSVVWFAGALHPVAGRVAMDVFMLDVGAAPVSEGDEVVLFGDPAEGLPSPDAWAARLGKTAAEVVSSVHARVPRSYR